MTCVTGDVTEQNQNWLQNSYAYIKDCIWLGYWTARGYANSQIANSRTGRLEDWTTRGLDDSRTGQLAD